jgi:DNA-binding NtrC family response regulator
MNTDLEDKLSTLKEDLGLYGTSPEMDEIYRVIATVAPTDLSVLIIGESGTGKEVVARAIHALSRRKEHTMITVNTGAIPEGILESELFGHEKGAFTGAVSQKKGYFEAADRGTIFLDEIGEMSLNTQVKLLRVIEESEFMRVGGTDTHKVDVRIITATNKNLENAVKNGEFRQDLYFRLKAITVDIPPLRKRIGDLPVLIRKFTADTSDAEKTQFKGFSPEAIEVMKQYDWPGNIRELRNFVETSLILNRGEVVNSGYVSRNLPIRGHDGTSTNLPVPLNISPEQAEREIIYRTLLALKVEMTEIKQILLNLSAGQYPRNDIEFDIHRQSEQERDDQNELRPTTLAGMERELIKDTLNKFGGSRRKAARALQISERTLYRKIKDYGI